MANFSNLITTAQGHALNAAILAGEVLTEPQSPFTRIVTSSAVYQLSELEALTTLSEIQQQTLVSGVTRQNETTVQIHGGMNNSDLTVGYRLNTVGVYFQWPNDAQEYLFGAAIHKPTPEEPSAEFIFPFNGSTTTGLIFDLLASVGNADNISLDVNPAATVTIIQLRQAIQNVIELSNSNIPRSGTRLHMRTVEEVPDYMPYDWTPPIGNVLAAKLNIEGIGVRDAVLILDEMGVQAWQTQEQK